MVIDTRPFFFKQNREEMEMYNHNTLGKLINLHDIIEVFVVGDAIYIYLLCISPQFDSGH